MSNLRQFATMLTTAEHFADLLNGITAMENSGFTLENPPTHAVISSRFMVGAQRLDDRQGFRFIDGSEAWRRDDGRWDVSASGVELTLQ